MVVSAADRAWIESRGGVVGVVSEQEAQIRESTWAARESMPHDPGTSMLGIPVIGGQQQGLYEAGFPLIPLAIAAATKIIPKALPYITGAVAALGIGGLFDNGDGQYPAEEPGAQYGVPFGGPGLKEPGKPYLLREWHIKLDAKEGDFSLQFYLTQNARGTKRIFMYNTRTKAWKSWAPPRLAVIGKNMPSHQMITRLRRNLKRQTADAVTILKLTSPGKLESTRRPGGKWVKGRKRYID